MKTSKLDVVVSAVKRNRFHLDSIDKRVLKIQRRLLWNLIHNMTANDMAIRGRTGSTSSARHPVKRKKIAGTPRDPTVRDALLLAIGTPKLVVKKGPLLLSTGELVLS